MKTILLINDFLFFFHPFFAPVILFQWVKEENKTRTAIWQNFNLAAFHLSCPVNVTPHGVSRDVRTLLRTHVGDQWMWATTGEILDENFGAREEMREKLSVGGGAASSSFRKIPLVNKRGGILWSENPERVHWSRLQHDGSVPTGDCFWQSRWPYLIRRAPPTMVWIYYKEWTHLL